MKALSLKDYGTPETNYATLVEQGIKSIETRTWSTSYRGDLLICCSKSSKSSNAGLALCVVELVEVRRMQEEDIEKACIDLYPNAYSWILANHRRLSRKFDMKGALSLFKVDLPADIELIETHLFTPENHTIQTPLNF